MTEWKMWVGLGQLQHPLLVILEVDITVVHVLVNMTLQLIYKLLLVETVNLLWDEGLVMTQCRDNATNQGKALEAAANLVSPLADGPALCDQLFNLLRVDHH